MKTKTYTFLSILLIALMGIGLFCLSGCQTTDTSDVGTVLVEEGSQLGVELATMAVIRKNPEYYDVAEVVAGLLEKAAGTEDPDTLRADVIQLVKETIDDPADELLAVTAVNRIGNIVRRIEVKTPEQYRALLQQLAASIRTGASSGVALAEG